MPEGKKITGVVFSDLGQGASFMALDWVQRLLRERLGFTPYAGTLNLRLLSDQEVALWNDLRMSIKGVDIVPPEPSFCRARCLLARIEGLSQDGADGMRVAVLIPEVDSYPANKVEVIAPFPIKESLHLQDGDRLTLQFIGN
ncbi:MAG: DUF120 domain-containing protein [Candidatus Binatia bacterium]|jgi:CTP-dependent riboflavin kinase